MGYDSAKFSTVGQVIATYTFQDLVDGQGNLLFYPVYSFNGDFTEQRLPTHAEPSNTTTGMLRDGTYFFKTKDYIFPAFIEGDAILTGTIDKDTQDITIAATISIERGIHGAVNSIIDNVETEYIATTQSYVKKNTFTINDYVYSIVSQQKNAANSQSNSIKYIIYYAGNETKNVFTGTNSSTYTEITALNPFPDRFIVKIEMWAKEQGGFSDQYFIKEQDVYDPLPATYVSTNISSTIDSPTYTLDQQFNIKLPLTKTTINKDDRIVLKLVTTGTDGGLVVDPTAAFITDKETLKLKIPFNTLN